jgi:di/tricarboxylate transporter
MSMEKHLRRAGILVSLGLIIQLLSLIPLHPLAFIGFTALAVPFTAVGVAYFLLSLVRNEETETGQSGQKQRPD